MRRGSDPWRRLILPHLIHATGGLDLVTGTPPGDEGTREGGIGKIDGHRIVEHAASPRRRHRPSVCPAILVQPCLDLVEPTAQASGRNANSYADREAPFCLGYHEPGASGHACVPFSFSMSFPQTAR